MTAWNYASIWEIAADQLPDAPAQIQGDRTITWSELDRRADGVAATLIAAGVQQQDKVAQYLYNCPEYMESMYAAFKAGLVPVNTNYRYADDELLYLWDNADAVAVVFHGAFSERIERIRERLPRVQTWLWVDDGSGPKPRWAVAYEDAAATPSKRVDPPWGRGDDDLLLLYTGGTTGMPKGVMWRQDTLVSVVSGNTDPVLKEGVDYDHIRRTIQQPGMKMIPGCPLMHGTGMFTALTAMTQGGCVVTLTNRHLDIDELLTTIEREQVAAMAIVGDAFAKPIVRALDDDPGRYDISSLIAITSSGVMWSQETKDALLRHHPGMILMDAFSSSEALGLGSSMSGAGATAGTAKFTLGPSARVIDDDGRDVEPGSGQMGRVAVKGYTPVGYYKDPEKSARTFVELDGETYSIPGDYAMVEADGSLTLLGRGSVCINTAGEKVFPEEVEEVLKRHAAVRDAVVVGLPDDKYGEAITAVVEAAPGESIDTAALIEFVKTSLASYKAPKTIVPIDTIGRAANGKVDYKRMKRHAADTLGVPLPA